MQVILLERIGKLGHMGDEVTVKDGYARNYLLPRGKALRATQANRARFEREREQIEARNLELKKEAEDSGKELDGSRFVAIRQASESGQLYGSVSTRDIAKLIGDAGFSTGRSQVELHSPIKTLGLHTVQLNLHPEVDVSVTINVARSEEEAERQARGLAVSGEPVDEAAEAVAMAEEAFDEVFEDEELAKEVQETLQEAAEEDAAEATAEDADASGGGAEESPDAGDEAEPAEKK